MKDLICSNCGEELLFDKKKDGKISIQPCETCIEDKANNKIEERTEEERRLYKEAAKRVRTRQIADELIEAVENKAEELEEEQ